MDFSDNIIPLLQKSIFLFFDSLNNRFFLIRHIFIGKKSKKKKWKPIETEVISIASGTCWADEVEKEQNGISNKYINRLIFKYKVF